MKISMYVYRLDVLSLMYSRHGGSLSSMNKSYFLKECSISQVCCLCHFDDSSHNLLTCRDSYYFPLPSVLKGIYSLCPSVHQGLRLPRRFGPSGTSSTPFLRRHSQRFVWTPKDPEKNGTISIRAFNPFLLEFERSQNYET